MIRAIAGYAAVAALKFLGYLPPRFILAVGTPWLPFYAVARCRSLAYYRMRLRLAALSVRHLTGHWNDMPIHIKGREHYHAALATGKPVVLLGWHQGPVELLHHIPPAPKDGRPFLILTANGFSPILTRFMRRGRNQADKHAVGPTKIPATLRSWARQRGVLAVMVDQVPGTPESWLSFWKGKVEIPFPKKLLDWLRNHNAIFIAVSVRVTNIGSIEFCYLPVESSRSSLERLMETAIEEARNQYNWSYPKIKGTKNGRARPPPFSA